MKRLSPVAIVLCLGVTAPSYAEGKPFIAGELTQAETDRVADALRVSPVRAMLRKRVDSVRWDETPLVDVVEWLSHQSTDRGRVNVIVRWNTLKMENIDGDNAVTLNMVDTTVGDVLDEVLEQLSDVDPLTYIGVGNTLKISTQSFVNSKLYVRVYNIDEIFNGIVHFSDAPQLDVSQPLQSGGGSGGTGNVTSVFKSSGGGGKGNQNSEDEEKERTEEIIKWLRTTVEPDSWSAHGGKGTVYILNHMLTVRNTLSVHEIIAGRFALRE